LQITYFSSFSHFWLATPQLVLQADWQEVWHSPQPPFLALSHISRVSRVLILSIIHISILFEMIGSWTLYETPPYNQKYSITGILQSQGICGRGLCAAPLANQQ
jgi:hypothetical protein